LTPTVNILSGEVKAKTAGDTDKGGVIARRLAGQIAALVAAIRLGGGPRRGLASAQGSIRRQETTRVPP
jgi:hypothetical protein